VSKRVSPTARLRADIDELFSSDRELSSILEDVAPVGRRHRQLGSQRRPRGQRQLYVGTADGQVIAYGLP
jgi:hypothetical protein